MIHLYHFVNIEKGIYYQYCLILNLSISERIRHKPILQDGLPENVTAPFGGNATFECRIVVTDAHATIQWLKHYKVNGSYINKDTEQAYYEVIQASLPYGVSLYDLTK